MAASQGRPISAYLPVKKKTSVKEQASVKALLFLKRNGLLSVDIPTLSIVPHAWVDMRANALSASSTCRLLPMWGDSFRGVVVG